MNNLQLRRLAAHALNTLLKDRQLGSRAHHFQSDAFEDWDVRSDWEIFALIDRKEVAEAYITRDKIEIIIPSWYSLIRTEHLDEFDPDHFGLEIDNRYHPVTLEPFPDEHVQMPLVEPQGFNLPERVIHRSSSARKPKVICSR